MTTTTDPITEADRQLLADIVGAMRGRLAMPLADVAELLADASPDRYRAQTGLALAAGLRRLGIGWTLVRNVHRRRTEQTLDARHVVARAHALGAIDANKYLVETMFFDAVTRAQGQGRRWLLRRHAELSDRRARVDRAITVLDTLELAAITHVLTTRGFRAPVVPDLLAQYVGQASRMAG